MKVRGQPYVLVCIFHLIWESLSLITSAYTWPALTSSWALCFCVVQECQDRRWATALSFSQVLRATGCHICMVSALSRELSPRPSWPHCKDQNAVNSQNPEEKRFMIRLVLRARHCSYVRWDRRKRWTNRREVDQRLVRAMWHTVNQQVRCASGGIHWNVENKQP